MHTNSYTQIAKAIAYISHPIWMPFYAIVFFSFKNNWAEKSVVLTTVVLFLVIFPIVTIFIFQKMKKADADWMFFDAKNRRIPVAIQSFFVIVLWLLCQLLFPENSLLLNLIKGIAYTTLGALILLFMHTKASLHVAGIVGWTTCMVLSNPQNRGAIIVLTLLSIGIACLRYYQKAHSLTEIVYGLLLGSICMYSAFL